MYPKIYLGNELEKIWNKIKNKENFVLLRYGDGERAIMTGHSVKAQEGWVSPNGNSSLGLKLLETLNLTGENVYYGIPCPCCDIEAYYWYSSRIENKNITFANIFVNTNYQKFITSFSTLNFDAIFIGNYRAKNKPIGNLNILKRYFVDDDCFNFYDNNYDDFINGIKRDFGYKNDILYVVSAGPLSEIIISDLYKNNPNNCYIDFGSSIDKFIHDKPTRPYMNQKSQYAQQHCFMYDPMKTKFDITVVLSAYKRVEYLKLQLDAIEKQTIKPKEIILFQDGINDGVKIEVPVDIIKRFDRVEISDTNKGVWARFDFARRTVKSEYVCIFDDDTIPGSRWLENCLSQMHKQVGLYGTIGILCKTEFYGPDSSIRIGWANPNETTHNVDFVGHSWFLKTEWLKYMFEGTEDMQAYKVCAEDMTLSCQLQKHGINTYVPPHPINKKELWGAIPEYANEFGNDKNSLFVNNGWNKMSEAFDLLVKRFGFKIVKNCYPNEFKKAYIGITKKKSFIKSIFSVTNEYSINVKRKVITILGIKIKFHSKFNFLKT